MNNGDYFSDPDYDDFAVLITVIFILAFIVFFCICIGACG